jgi:2-phosphosulfolactate phosphatase
MTSTFSLDGRSDGRSFTIDAFPPAALKYPHGYAIVAVDVIRATTTAITAVSMGRRCFMAPTADDASMIAQDLPNPILAGELGGNVPFGFEMNNSPADVAGRTDVERPLILVTSSGTLLAHNASLSGHGFVACLRNYLPTARHLATRYKRIALIGAGSRAEFREEDQACCAKLGLALRGLGFAPENDETHEMVSRWENEEPEGWMVSNSVRFLRSTGQEDDLAFVRAHQSDLDQVFQIQGDGEVLAVASVEAGEDPAIGPGGAKSDPGETS